MAASRSPASDPPSFAAVAPKVSACSHRMPNSGHGPEPVPEPSYGVRPRCKAAACPAESGVFLYEKVSQEVVKRGSSVRNSL